MGEIPFEAFLQVDIRVGTVLEARLNEKARKPAYVLTVDFGDEIGVKISSAQITEAYQLDDLLRRQVLAVVNFPEKNIAGIVSQVFILAVVQEDGRTILIAPDMPVANGARLL